MDSLIIAAARALAVGDLLGALKRVALRDDPRALALRGIVMARLGDLDRAKVLLRSAARAFGPKELVARARCVVAEAEIALVSRDLAQLPKRLEAARTTLQAHGDHLNAAHARTLEARHLLLIGRLDEAERLLAKSDPIFLPPAWRAAYELSLAGIAIRRVRTAAALSAFSRAKEAALQANIPALIAEVENASEVLESPAARLILLGQQRLVRLDEIEKLLSSQTLVVDACRYAVRQGGGTISLATRPVLFALTGALAEAWPGDVPRSKLIERAFSGKEADESHRARLRVEIARLRVELGAIANVLATKRGFVLAPLRANEVVVLAPPVEEQHATVLALLADGESWSSSAVAIALGTSSRTVQRAFEDLAAKGKVQSYGLGRARRWIVPAVPGFPSALLLPGPLPGA